MAIYDKYYETPNYFGPTYEELIHHMDQYDRGNYVIDLGCGQGRDSLALARLGFKVSGIDISKVGIQQLIETAQEESLELDAFVEDIDTYISPKAPDIVLFNSMFHFYPKDLNQETMRLYHWIKQLKFKGHLIIIMLKSSKSIKSFKKVISNAPRSPKLIHEQDVIYKEVNATFTLFDYQLDAKK